MHARSADAMKLAWDTALLAQLWRQYGRQCTIDIVLFVALFALLQIVEHVVAARPLGKVEIACAELYLYNLPYKPDTIRSLHLTVICVSIALVVITCNELLLRSAFASTDVDQSKVKATPWFVDVYRFIGIGATGVVSVLLLTDFFKLTLRKPRPYYLDVCDNDMYVRNSCKTPDALTVVTSCHAVGFAQKVASEATLSMPSGHTSAATVTCFYLVAYMHYRGQALTRISWLLLPLTQLVLAILASVNAVLRISDNAHHSIDVAVGAAIGIVVAAWLIYTARLWRYDVSFENTSAHNDTYAKLKTVNTEICLSTYRGEINGHGLSTDDVSREG